MIKVLGPCTSRLSSADARCRNTADVARLGDLAGFLPVADCDTDAPLARLSNLDRRRQMPPQCLQATAAVHRTPQRRIVPQNRSQALLEASLELMGREAQYADETEAVGPGGTLPTRPERSSTSLHARYIGQRRSPCVPMSGSFL